MAVPERATITFAIRGPIVRADLPGLCDRVGRLLTGSDARIALCDVSEIVEADAVALDALARLQLEARRRGCQIRLQHVSAPLRALLTFMGFDDVLPEVH